MNPLNFIGSKPTPEHLSGRGSEFVAGIHNRLHVMDLAVQRVREEAFMNNRTLVVETPAPIESSHTAVPAQPEQQPATFDFPIAPAPQVPDNQPATTAQFETAEAALINEVPQESLADQARRAAEAARREQEGV